MSRFPMLHSLRSMFDRDRSAVERIARVCRWEIGASWRPIGTGPDGLRIEIWGRYLEAAFAAELLQLMRPLARTRPLRPMSVR
jgi:hypothetical protein